MESWQEKLAQAAQQIGVEVSPTPSSKTEKNKEVNISKMKNPLQTLNCLDFSKESAARFSDSQPEEERLKFLLEATAKADKETCQPLYDILNQRTETLAEEILTVHFPGRLRVGGIQGFRERLLPVLHPVYGVPYIPASSIKGVVSTWAKQQYSENLEVVHRLFGFLKQTPSEDVQKASLGTVQILDAFPTAPCLSLDVATPQWNWKENQVEYGPSPHYMMSLRNVTLKIGLVRTNLGSKADVEIAREWLEKALIQEGLGSRISAGYGRVNQAGISTTSTDSQVSESGQQIESRWRSSSHSFEVWSQGIYSVEDQLELRSVSIRGVLRYWFRAVALNFCSPQDCKKFEAALFGSIDTTLNRDKKPTQGSVRIAIDIEQESDVPNWNRCAPYYAKGRIHLESLNRGHLTLIEYILKLAMHLGGVGRGSRRPLHYNSGRLRGCYWQAAEPRDILRYDADEWKKFLDFLQDICQGVCRQLSLSSQPIECSPGDNQNRHQDVLNQNAWIYLVKANHTKHPRNVPSALWNKQGQYREVLGPALDFWYKSGFKGGTGNIAVGGKLGTPSFVWIASNNLDNDSNEAYQVITVFGSDHPERKKFIEAIQNSQDIQEKIEVELPWNKSE